MNNKSCLRCKKTQEETLMDKDYGCFVGGHKVWKMHKYVIRNKKLTK